MFHHFFFHPGLDSCYCHDALSDAMALAAAIKVEKDLEKKMEER